MLGLGVSVEIRGYGWVRVRVESGLETARV